MASNHSRMAIVRSRLAASLGVRALISLVLLGLAGASFAWTAVRVALATWGELATGDVASAIELAALFLLSAAAAAYCLSWLSAPPECPVGVRLEPDSARALYRIVSRMAVRFGHVRIDAIWVGGDMNAAILQRPRWGCVGPLENHLIIGLPLAHCVSRRQFSAILAHELAHLAYQRQGFAAWSSHFRAWWFRALDRCVEDLPWTAWLVDRISARDMRDALRLSRIEEFEADMMAARVVTPRLVGESLLEVALKERFLSENYWRTIMAQSEVQPVPSIRPYREMGLGVMAGFRRPAPGPVDIGSLFDEGQAMDDFHPSLTSRLRALGVTPVIASGEPVTAAVRYLSPLLPTLAWAFDRAWWHDSRHAWRRCYERSRTDLR